MRARAFPLAVLSIVVALSACSTEVSSDDLTAEDAVLCRELGGGWVHIRYEAGEVHGSRTGIGLEGQLGEDLTDRELEEAQRLREANGWDDAALDDLRRPGGPSEETVARLEQMPSCLAELRATDGDRGR